MLRLTSVSVSYVCVCVGGGGGGSVSACRECVRALCPGVHVSVFVSQCACMRACVRACARAEHAASVSVYARVTDWVCACACVRHTVVAAFRRLRVGLKHTNRLNWQNATADFFDIFILFYQTTPQNVNSGCHLKFSSTGRSLIWF